jgi:hypothetical protein
MDQPKRCEAPNCTGAPLVKMEHESSPTVGKFYCSNPTCGRIYIIPTTIGKVAQLAPLALIGSFAMALFTHDWEDAIRDTLDTLDNLLS